MATPARKLFLYLAPVTASNDLGFHRPWKPVAHWALCVGGICFELTRLPQPSATGATHGSSVVTLAEWRSVRDRDGRQYKGSAVGHHCTRWSDREIEECGEFSDKAISCLVSAITCIRQSLPMLSVPLVDFPFRAQPTPFGIRFFVDNTRYCQANTAKSSSRCLLNASQRNPALVR